MKTKPKAPYHSESELYMMMDFTPKKIAEYIAQLEAALKAQEAPKPVTETIKAPVTRQIKVNPYRTWARVINIAGLSDVSIFVVANDDSGFSITVHAGKWAVYGEDIKESCVNNTFIVIDYDIDKENNKILISAVPF